MGTSFTRSRNRGEESGEISSQSNSYRYPPKNGCYFGTHFIMGGERFESPQPGEYLFGDSEELNFLGNKPIPFPYPVPSGNEPTKTLKSLVYIRKDSLRLVKAEKKAGTGDSTMTGSAYNVEFTFDCDVRCTIQIHYFSSEEITNGLVVYHPMDSSLSSEVFHYKRGAGQIFSQAAHTLDPTKFAEEEWQCNFEKEIYPIVIHCSVEEEEHAGHSHITYAVLERNQEGVYAIKPLKQKQVVDGLCYLLQEIYGIENKTMERMKDVDPDDEVEDSGAECVICMSDMRDTLILPCRHLCLCSSCADSLRYQASMCPICRVKFRALLQIRAMRKKTALGNNTPHSEPEDNPVNQEGVPPGYEAISLIEALNGQVVPPLNSEGVHLQISSGPPAVFALDKKGHKDSKIMVQCPIEYQKEMDTDKESNKGTLEKKDKDNATIVDSTDIQSDATPDEVIPRPVVKDVTQPFKSTVVTVRHSPDGSITTETKISPVLQSEMVVAPNASPRAVERGPFKTNINISRLACGLSTGDMADDEREDSSEPEPDYDEHDSDDLVTMTSTSQPDLSMSASESLSNIPISPGPVQAESYDPLQVQVGNLTDVQCSGTEGSSFGSNSSSHALLTPGEQQVSNNAVDKPESDKEGEPVI